MMIKKEKVEKHNIVDNQTMIEPFVCRCVNWNLFLQFCFSSIFESNAIEASIYGMVTTINLHYDAEYSIVQYVVKMINK